MYLTIQELLRAVDARLFPLIVAINFDYYHAAWIHQCRFVRITFKTEYETERIKMESRRQFINAYDAWELSKKDQNDAISQLRALEQDVKKHTAVGSVLEAFLTADPLIVSNLQNAITSRYPALCSIRPERVNHDSCHARGD